MQELLPVCPVCESINTRREPFHYEFKGRQLHGYLCGKCGIIFVFPQPTSEEISQLYSAEYFESGDFRCGHEGNAFAPGSQDHLVNGPALAGIRSIRPSGRLLEVGCAGGAFLNAARNHGYDVVGVELSGEACAKARAEFGLNVIQGDLLDAKFPGASFDVVYMGDVLEHLPDPIRAVNELHRILRSGGLLVLEVPAQTNTLFSRLGFPAYGLLRMSTTVRLPPYHLFEYRPKSIRFLLEHIGFDVLRVEQTCIPPKEINLRGGLFQRAGKMILQYPNFVLTRTLQVYGDRLAVYATRGQSRQ
ncbi:MAG: class I SAM-dependent methyltransferase [Bacteroidota bacterium]